MNEWNTLDFKPRARGMIIGDIPWLARIADKAAGAPAATHRRLRISLTGRPALPGGSGANSRSIRGRWWPRPQTTMR